MKAHLEGPEVVRIVHPNCDYCDKRSSTQSVEVMVWVEGCGKAVTFYACALHLKNILKPLDALVQSQPEDG